MQNVTRITALDKIRQKRFFLTCSGYSYNETCVTIKDSDQPVQPPSMAKVLVYPIWDNLKAVEFNVTSKYSKQTAGRHSLSESLLMAQVLL